MVFVAEPVLWTEVPSSRAVLARQRRRWHRGLWEALWKYRGMALNPRYGRIGAVGLPYYWAFELAAPVLELAGLVLVPVGLLLGAVRPDTALLLTVVAYAYAYAMVVTLAALCVEEFFFHRYPRWRDLGGAVVAAVLENLGYQQLTAWWRAQGLCSALARRRQVWGTMTRVGFGDDAAAPARPLDAA